MAKELSQEEVNRLAGAVVDKAMEAARECKDKYPYDPKAFFRCCLPAFRQEMTHRGTDPEAIKVAKRFGLVFDGMMENLYEFTIAKGPEEAKGITFVVSDLSKVESRLAEKLKEFGIEEGNPARKKHYSRPYLTNWQYGGYSYVEEDPTKPESLWPYGMVDYVNPDEVIAITEREGLLEISLAGGFWERIGYKGWGEKVSISEAKSVLAKAKEHMQAPSSSNPGKEPWQMTKQEYVRPPYTSPAMHRFGVEKALREGKPIPPEVLADYPDLQKKSNPGKSPWQMTLEEYAHTEAKKYGHGKPRIEWIKAGYGETYRSHKTAIERAIKEGKLVPPEVLADYPDLQKKGGSNPQEPDLREMIISKTYPGAPSNVGISVFPTKSFSQPGKYALFSVTQNATFGKIRDTFQEAVEAANKENLRIGQPLPLTQPIIRPVKKLLSPEQISDFDVSRDKVVRRGEKTFVIDTTGQRADVEVASDVITPEFEVNLKALKLEQRQRMIREVRQTPYLSEQGKEERLTVLKAKPPEETKEGNPSKEHWQMTEAEYSQWAESLGKRYNEILGEPVDPHSPVGREAEQRAFGQLKKETGLIELTFTDMAGMGHKAKVRIAISEGKPVPPEVLADYPDLQKKGNPGEYVTIIDPGKTTFKVGEVVSREAFEKENERVIRLDEKPATER